MNDTFATLPLSAIAPSLTNPRKNFRADKLTELAESIKASGVHQPILVRPLPGSRTLDTERGVTHELIAGERRYRASLQAGLTSIPALVRDLSDDQVLEVQIVENLQRDDLTELEEAQGYDALMRHSNLTSNEVAAKIGKSRSYVYARIKLLDLSSECQQAMQQGDIDASRALLIARIPDTALQTKALNEAMRKDFRGEVCSVRALQSWLQANVMLALDKASFVITDSRLVVAAGPCTTCPKRTGASPDLFADVGADICTDPACYHGKEDAHRASVLASAEKRGMRLIEGEDAEDICSQWNNSLDGYSPLNQERSDTFDGQPATLGQLLGKDLPDAVLIENPWTKKLIAAVPTKEAEAMLLARGLVKAMQAKAASKDDIEGQIKRLQDRAQKDITTRFRHDAFEALAKAVHGLNALNFRIMDELLRAWWLRQMDELDNDDSAKLFALELETKSGIEREITDYQTTQIRLHIQACPSDNLYKALVLYMVMEDNPSYFYGDLPDPTLFEALASEIDMDLDEIEVEAAHAERDNYADELKKLKAQLKPKANDITATGYRGPNGETWSGRGLMPKWLAVLVQAGQSKETYRITPNASAAQAKGGGGTESKDKAAKTGDAPATKAPLRKRKLSTAEAQAAIAAAMQGQETNPGADAQGKGVDSSQPVAADVADAPKASLAVDTRVAVTSDNERLPVTQWKWAGKEGTITQAMDDNRYMVSFRGRTGGMCAFNEADLTAVVVV